MQNNNLTRFDEGGSHSQNPLGGVPMGQSQNGQMNTVEEGETKKKNYIYSDRLSIDENMTKEMNLPSYIKGKTFALASKAIDNKFKDRYDKYSSETKNTLLDRLKEAQETLKQQEQQRAEQIAQSMQSNQQQVPDMMNGEIPQGMEEYTEEPEQKQFFAGGDITQSEVGNQTGGMSGLSGKMSPYLQGASALGNSFQSPIVDQSVDTINPQLKQSTEGIKDTIGKAIPVAGLFRGVEKAGKSLGQSIGGNTGGDYTNGFLDPAQTVMRKDTNFGEKLLSVMDPIVSGYITHKHNDINRAKAMNSAALSYNKQFQDNNFAKGGYITNKPTQYAGGGYTTTVDPLIIPNEGMSDINQRYPFESIFKPTNTIPQVGYQAYQSPINQQYNDKNIPLISKMNVPDSSGWNSYKTYGDLGKTIQISENKEGSIFNKTTNKVGDYLDKNGGKILKYAPVAMNAYQLSKLKKPVNQRLQRLDDKYKPQYVDEVQLQNIANQELTNTINSLSQSGASQGAIRNAILGAGLNKTKALSDAYMKANAENRATDDKAQTFNLGVNQFNTQTQHQESENWEKNAAAYRNEKSKYLASIGTDLGSIGKEEVNKNQIAEALGYDVNGDYVINKKTGEKMLTKDFEEKVKNGTLNKKYNFGNADKFTNSSINYTPNTNFKIGKI